MALADLWALELLVAAFAGGAFGAAIGALPAFTVTGLLVVVGELHAIAVRSLGVGSDLALTSSLAFGPVFGPHVSFAGGAAAAAYAAKRGYFDGDGSGYHPAKNVTEGLGSRPDVLAVGGVFGVVGYWAATLSGSLALPWDPVAFGVVASALAHRAALGYDLVGAPVGRLLDMRPFEEQRAATDGGAVAVGRAADDTGDARTVEPWLPYQYRWSHVVALGLAVGALGGYVAYLTASAFLAFGVTVVALVYVNADVAKIPITHHVVLPASTVVLALAGGATDPAAVAAAVPLGTALAAGAAFGLVGALCGEVCQRVLYAHADTHLDPPAASIVLTSLLVGVLAMAGILPTAVWVPTP